ncbi:MAG: hypothetical protein K5849_02795 [Bacteroidales bacterium]|nr:hypothetical protein [Bacteroidales bacterium]
MKKIIYSLCLACVIFAACEPEDLTYTYEDLSFKYTPEVTIAEETPLDNGMRLLILGEENAQMTVEIIRLGGNVENASWEEKEAFVKGEADNMMRRLLNDPAYAWTWEPVPYATKHDRWSSEDEIPSAGWDMYLAMRQGEPIAMAIKVRLFRDYEVRQFLEAPNSEELGQFGTITLSFGLEQ